MTDPQQKRMAQEPELAEIMEHHLFQSMVDYRHHSDTSCLEHTLLVAGMVYTTAKRWKLDHISATRGALLHDFYLYDWHTGGPGLHGFKHPGIAVRNAERHFELNRIERNAILRHMWPLTPIPPRYPEALLVSLADKVSSYREYQQAIQLCCRRMGRKFYPGSLT